MAPRSPRPITPEVLGLDLCNGGRLPHIPQPELSSLSENARALRPVDTHTHLPAGAGIAARPCGPLGRKNTWLISGRRDGSLAFAGRRRRDVATSRRSVGDERPLGNSATQIWPRRTVRRAAASPVRPTE